jgi:hypothetical protein
VMFEWCSFIANTRLLIELQVLLLYPPRQTVPVLEIQKDEAKMAGIDALLWRERLVRELSDNLMSVKV